MNGIRRKIACKTREEHGEARDSKDWRARDYGNEGEEGAHITDAAASAPPQGAFVLPLLSPAAC